MYEMGEQLERVILAGVQTYESDDTVQSLYELRELAETAGAVTVGTIMQSRETIHPATYLGKGKLEELKELLYDLDATGVICDDELSPAQLNNLEQELECKVMDRTMVILDIFAQRAKTSEGNAKASENEARQLVEAAKKVVNTDKTLTIDGAPADAKTVGDKFKSIKTDWNSVTDKPSTFPPSAHNHSKLAFEQNNEVNFVGTPQDNTVYWGYRGNTIDEYRFNDGRGSGAFANVRANKFIGSLDGGVTDYNNSGNVIKIGYAGDGLNTSNLTSIAGYTDNGTKIKDVSKAVLQSWLGVTTIASQTSDPGAGSSLATGSILLVYA